MALSLIHTPRTWHCGPWMADILLSHLVRWEKPGLWSHTNLTPQFGSALDCMAHRGAVWLWSVYLILSDPQFPHLGNAGED